GVRLPLGRALRLLGRGSAGRRGPGRRGRPTLHGLAVGLAVHLEPASRRGEISGNGGRRGSKPGTPGAGGGTSPDLLVPGFVLLEKRQPRRGHEDRRVSP